MDWGWQSMESSVYSLGKILLRRCSWARARNVGQESWQRDRDLCSLCGLHYLTRCEPQLNLANILRGILASWEIIEEFTDQCLKIKQISV